MTSRENLKQHQIVRVVYSLRDFERAFSALTFLREPKRKEDCELAHLRRHYCFEMTAIVSYARPFSRAYGPVSPLSMTDLSEYLDISQIKLHERILNLRNKAFAHSDFDAMEFRIDPIFIDGENRSVAFPVFNVPEGPGFLDQNEILLMESLVKKLINHLAGTVFEFFQGSTEPLIVSAGRIINPPHSD
ncbi:MAG: hypothetical protein RIB45_03045 [Marivibrio sp.]|uniref:hypothetical protein n=1 Tax=Marivibrio sp. TaxID=2039719 RepID=UPI0032EFA2C5